MNYDLAVIGGGAAGLAAAREARRRDVSVLLVTEGPPGGECTFTGCVPSKTLIAAAARGEPFGPAMKLVHEAVEQIARTEDEGVLRAEGIEVLRGRAEFRSRDEIQVDRQIISARRFVIATGARPGRPPVEGLDRVPYLTNENVFDLTELPPSLAILGGGPVGCELAQAFARFGSKVTLIERDDRLLATEEPEVSGLLIDAFVRDGIDVRTGVSVTRVEGTGGAVRLQLDAGDAVESAALLVATGQEPAVEGLGLEAAGIGVTSSGFVATDDSLATHTKGIWAAGDVTGRSPFTHAADEMGRIAAANAFGRARRRFDVRAMPVVVFTDPEIARVGCTTAELDSVAGPRVAFRAMADVDRAVTEGKTEGFVKLIGGKRRFLGNMGGGRLVGATIVCARAGELVNEAALAVRTKMFLGRIAQTTHAYPTWSTALRQTAAQFFGYGPGVQEQPGSAEPR